jgi:hypothetical protein
MKKDYKMVVRSDKGTVIREGIWRGISFDQAIHLVEGAKFVATGRSVELYDMSGKLIYVKH